MKINIYYGGRGLIGDPTLYVIKRMAEVLEELNVKVDRYDLFDQKANISKLPQTLKEADGVILASTVEWHGCGGYMAQFLDSCWFYGDKEYIKQLYMAPVVMSTTYGEKEGELDLINAWISLGGITCQGISGYAPEAAELENNETYRKLIEDAAENIYKAINRRTKNLPSSRGVVRQVTYRTLNTGYTQQETEQLSEYASDEKYVEKQKEDIKELADIFKEILGNRESEDGAIPAAFQAHFKPKAGTDLKYKISMKDAGKSLTLRVEGKELVTGYGEAVNPDMELELERETLTQITEGRGTFNGSFLNGKIISRGEMANLRLLDELFPFMEDLLKGGKQ
ncbi:MAG: SCP-2 sterol transfer family protein [Lachnospiraceae bacterium]|nr:SCP-2 sterol transfer family protein [Lachnospiraceae bacterium]